MHLVKNNGRSDKILEHINVLSGDLACKNSFGINCVNHLNAIETKIYFAKDPENFKEHHCEFDNFT